MWSGQGNGLKGPRSKTEQDNTLETSKYTYNIIFWFIWLKLRSLNPRAGTSEACRTAGTACQGRNRGRPQRNSFNIHRITIEKPQVWGRGEMLNVQGTSQGLSKKDPPNLRNPFAKAFNKPSASAELRESKIQATETPFSRI